jgi:hypothetical protein
MIRTVHAFARSVLWGVAGAIALYGFAAWLVTLVR